MTTGTEDTTLVQQTDAYEGFELADEDQILAEIAGRVTEKYVYTFKQDGQEVTGLSYAGTNWACREYAKQGEAIRVTDIKKEADPVDPDYILVTVWAQRFAIRDGHQIPLDNTVVTKRQWRFMDKKKYENGQVVGKEQVPDKFFWEKAVSKGVRNAKQALMPTDFVKKIIQSALQKKGQRPNGPREQQQQQPRQQQQRPPQQGQRPSGPPPENPQGPPPERPAGPPPERPQGQRPPAGPPPERPTTGQQPGPQPQRPPPQQQQRPSGPPPERPRQQQPPAQQRAPAQPAPGVPNQTVSRPGQSPREAGVDSLRQRLNMLLWQVTGKSNDRQFMNVVLKDLTGIELVSETPAPLINELAPLLQGVVSGQNTLQNGAIHRKATGEQLWPKPEPQYEETPPPQEEPPPSPPQEETFI